MICSSTSDAGTPHWSTVLVFLPTHGPLFAVLRSWRQVFFPLLLSLLLHSHLDHSSRRKLARHMSHLHMHPGACIRRHTDEREMPSKTLVEILCSSILRRTYSSTLNYKRCSNCPSHSTRARFYLSGLSGENSPFLVSSRKEATSFAQAKYHAARIGVAGAYLYQIQREAKENESSSCVYHLP